MLGKISPKLNLISEFSPSPKETIRIIRQQYLQKRNLLITFGDDKLDQGLLLLKCLNERDLDDSNRIQVNGDHLTPASAGLRKSIFGKWADDSSKARNLRKLIDIIFEWSCVDLSP